MKKSIAILAGDGIGPEIMQQTIRVLHTIEKIYGHEFTLTEALVGGAAFDHYGEHFPNQTLATCKAADGILFGSVGGPVGSNHLPKWHNCEKNSILALRQAFGFAINLRPAWWYQDLLPIYPLKKELVEQGLSIIIVRELLGDIYFGDHKQYSQAETRFAEDVAIYNEEQIAIAAKCAFEMAQKRSGKLTSVDKANVLDTSKLWRAVVDEIAPSYPNVKVEHMLVDNCAMQLILNPKQFDIILTANLFGDILSDELAGLVGGLGLMPSASINTEGFGLYEPAGGAAHDIAGKNIANPIAQILSLALMLRQSFAMLPEAKAIEVAVMQSLQQGYRTKDIYHENATLVTTEEMTNSIISNLTKRS